MKQYYITGKNKLTRQRDVITVPCSLANAKAILQREKAKPAHKRSYTNLKLSVYPITHEIIPFKNE